jgi:predicted ATPase
MWLEDLHWADSSSLDWLMAVAQQRRPARLLVIGTYRPADISLGGHPLRTVKQELLAKGQGAEVWMPYLTAEEVSQYLTLRYPQNQFPAACGNANFVSTDGNPPHGQRRDELVPRARSRR